MRIFFFEVNSKYISSSVVKNQYFSRVRSTIENADIFTTLDEMYTIDIKLSILYFQWPKLIRFDGQTQNAL